MGDKKISRSALALASGVKRSALSSKLDGKSEFTIGEIIAVAHALNRTWLWVLTGSDDDPDGGGGGAVSPGPASDKWSCFTNAGHLRLAAA